MLVEFSDKRFKCIECGFNHNNSRISEYLKRITICPECGCNSSSDRRIMVITPNGYMNRIRRNAGE